MYINRGLTVMSSYNLYSASSLKLSMRCATFNVADRLNLL